MKSLFRSSNKNSVRITDDKGRTRRSSSLGNLLETSKNDSVRERTTKERLYPKQPSKNQKDLTWITDPKIKEIVKSILDKKENINYLSEINHYYGLGAKKDQNSTVARNVSFINSSNKHRFQTVTKRLVRKDTEVVEQLSLINFDDRTTANQLFLILYQNQTTKSISLMTKKENQNLSTKFIEPLTSVIQEIEKVSENVDNRPQNTNTFSKTFPAKDTIKSLITKWNEIVDDGEEAVLSFYDYCVPGFENLSKLYGKIRSDVDEVKLDSSIILRPSTGSESEPNANDTISSSIKAEDHIKFYEDSIRPYIKKEKSSRSGPYVSIDRLSIINPAELWDVEHLKKETKFCESLSVSGNGFKPLYDERSSSDLTKTFFNLRLNRLRFTILVDLISNQIDRYRKIKLLFTNIHLGASVRSEDWSIQKSNEVINRFVDFFANKQHLNHYDQLIEAHERLRTAVTNYIMNTDHRTTMRLCISLSEEKLNLLEKQKADSSIPSVSERLNENINIVKTHLKLENIKSIDQSLSKGISEFAGSIKDIYLNIQKLFIKYRDTYSKIVSALTVPCFGVSIEKHLDYLSRNNSLKLIPAPLKKGIDWLEGRDSRGTINDALFQKRICIEGIYRIPGSKKEIDKLADHFNQGDYTLNENTVRDPCVVADFIKKYLRELPIRLVHGELEEKLFNYNVDGQNYERILDPHEDDLVNFSYIQSHQESIRDILNDPSNFSTSETKHIRPVLKKIIDHINLVTKHSSKNKMNAHALARMFSPNIFESKSPKHGNFDNTGVVLVEWLVNNPEYYFDEDYSSSAVVVETKEKGELDDVNRTDKTESTSNKENSHVNESSFTEKEEDTQIKDQCYSEESKFDNVGNSESDTGDYRNREWDSVSTNLSDSDTF